MRREAIAHRFDGFNGQLEARLRALLDDERRRCAVLGDPAREVVDAVERAVLDGGKRLRSRLMMIAFLGAGGSGEDPRVVQAGAALELLHTGCLVHDDVMGAARLRRGAPTAHVAFEQMHRRSGWLGDSEAFGTSTAILVGDLAFFHAMRLMVELNHQAQRVFHDIAIDVGMGEFLDLRAAAHAGPFGGERRVIARYETAHYTSEGPLHLGAALVRRSDELGPALSAYGRPLGEAYQLREDLLGKRSLLVSFAHDGQTGDEADHERTLRDLLAASGDRSRVASECDALVEQAVGAVDAIDITAEAKELLRRFARTLLHGMGEPAA